MTGIALHIRNLSVTHGGVAAIHDVSISVLAGETAVLLGANGAGKSSLLRAVIGLASSTGSVSLGGTDISQCTTEDRVRLGLAWVPEGRRVFPGLTVAENLLVASLSRHAERQRKLEEVFSLFPQLAGRPSDHAWQLSGGQQQMLAIGRAIMAKPMVYLLDEPSLGLAPAVAKSVAIALQQLASGGAAILIGEQNAGFVRSIADKTIMLRNGQITTAPADQGQLT